MTQLATALGLAGTALLSLGYAVRVTFDHDRLVDDERYGTASRAGSSASAQVEAAATLRDLVPTVRRRPREASLV